MSSHDQYAICLRMIQALSERGSWCGETHIQKASYVMQALRSEDCVWEFILYKHGPYSFDLHSTIEDLQGMKFVHLIVQEPYGPRIRLSKEGEDLLEKLAERSAAFESAIEKTASLLADKGVQQLEKISTALLLSKKYEGESDEFLAEKLHEVKPHVQLDEAHRAVSEFRVLATNFLT